MEARIPTPLEYIGQLMEWNTISLRNRLRKVRVQTFRHTDWPLNMEVTFNELGSLLASSVKEVDLRRQALGELMFLAESLSGIFDLQVPKKLVIVEESKDLMDIAGTINLAGQERTVQIHQRLKKAHSEEEDRELMPCFRVDTIKNGTGLRCSVRYFVDDRTSYWGCYIGRSEAGYSSPLQAALRILPPRKRGPRSLYVHPIVSTFFSEGGMESNLEEFCQLNRSYTPMLKLLIN